MKRRALIIGASGLLAPAPGTAGTFQPPAVVQGVTGAPDDADTTCAPSAVTAMLLTLLVWPVSVRRHAPKEWTSDGRSSSTQPTHQRGDEK